MNSLNKKINISLSPNAYLILTKEAQKRRVSLSSVIEDCLMNKVLSTKEKVDLVLSPEWTKE